MRGVQWGIAMFFGILGAGFALLLLWLLFDRESCQEFVACTVVIDTAKDLKANEVVMAAAGAVLHLGIAGGLMVHLIRSKRVSD